MIVGCYTLELYCDVKGCTYNSHGGRYLPDQFTGPTGGGCRNQARKFGWDLDIRRGMVTLEIAVCPTCAVSAKALREMMEAEA